MPSRYALYTRGVLADAVVADTQPSPRSNPNPMPRPSPLPERTASQHSARAMTYTRDLSALLQRAAPSVARTAVERTLSEAYFRNVASWIGLSCTRISSRMVRRHAPRRQPEGFRAGPLPICSPLLRPTARVNRVSFRNFRGREEGAAERSEAGGGGTILPLEAPDARQRGQHRVRRGLETQARLRFVPEFQGEVTLDPRSGTECVPWSPVADATLGARRARPEKQGVRCELPKSDSIVYVLSTVPRTQWLAERACPSGRPMCIGVT